MARNFVSKPQKRQEGSPDAFSFRLDGVLFKAELRDDADSVLEWSELAQVAVETEADIASAAGAAFIARFFKLMMAPDEYRRFRDHMRQRHTGQDVLVEIMQAINEEMETVVGQATDRPTGQPSRSSPGRGGRDDRTLQIISLPEGEYEFADAPETRPVRRQQPNRQQRRARQARQRRAG